MKAIEKFGKLLPPLMMAREVHRQNELRHWPDGKKEEIDEFVEWLQEQDYSGKGANTNETDMVAVKN